MNATDADQENHDNSDLRYSILSQDPELPVPNLFLINPVTGVIRINAGGLDREVWPSSPFLNCLLLMSIKLHPNYL